MRHHLLLIRHAKSAWDDSSLADHDRPLAARGAKALPGIRHHLLESGHRPERVLCSSSRRTQDTLAGIQATVADDAEVDVDPSLYLADANDLHGRLRRINEDVTCAMVIGHNPALQNLALLLIGEGNARDRAQVAAKLPTGAVVTLTFDSTWDELSPQTARLDALFLPRPPRT